MEEDVNVTLQSIVRKVQEETCMDELFTFRPIIALWKPQKYLIPLHANLNIKQKLTLFTFLMHNHGPQQKMHSFA